jgi:hypothetical protein
VLGRNSDKELFGISATLNFGPSGCISTGSDGIVTDGTTPTAFSFVPAPGSSGVGCATVQSGGAIDLPHQQFSNNVTTDTTYQGWVGAGGDVILWTRNEATGFEPGVIVAVREHGAHGTSKVTGTYTFTHLLGLASVRGEISMSNGNLNGGTLSTITANGIAITGGVYSASSVGNFAAKVVDQLSPAGLYQAGQAANYTANGFCPLLVTSKAAVLDASEPSAAPSLMVWVLQP